jgi:UDP-2-acetamido-2-deoxy-ribo-hexuluronate aminotransferase
MDTLQCAVVLAKLGRLDWELERRKAIGARYHERLAGLPLQLLAVRPDRDSVWGQYTVRVKDRARVQAALAADGIPTAVHYPRPLHRQPAYEHLGDRDACPAAIAASQEVMSLPMSADLGEEQQDRVVAALARALGAA